MLVSRSNTLHFTWDFGIFSRASLEKSFPGWRTCSCGRPFTVALSPSSFFFFFFFLSCFLSFSFFLLTLLLHRSYHFPKCLMSSLSLILISTKTRMMNKKMMPRFSWAAQRLATSHITRRIRKHLHVFSPFRPSL